MSTTKRSKTDASPLDGMDVDSSHVNGTTLRDSGDDSDEDSNIEGESCHSSDDEDEDETTEGRPFLLEDPDAVDENNENDDDNDDEEDVGDDGDEEEDDSDTSTASASTRGGGKRRGPMAGQQQRQQQEKQQQAPPKRESGRATRPPARMLSNGDFQETESSSASFLDNSFEGGADEPAFDDKDMDGECLHLCANVCHLLSDTSATGLQCSSR